MSIDSEFQTIDIILATKAATRGVMPLPYL